MNESNSIRQEIVRWLAAALPLDEPQVDALLAVPPSADMGDYAFPCFALARGMRKNPADIAAELAAKFSPTSGVTRAQAAGAYLNFSVDRPLMAATLLGRIHEQGERYGTSDLGAGKTIVIDYSSPNIAKHLGVHHLRSAIIGRALYRLLEAQGYRVVGINHLGDWGTSFGKLIAAFERQSDVKPETATVSDLQELYVRFSAEAEGRPELEDEARRAFQRLEAGDKKASKLWQRFRDVSLAEFSRIYEMLGIRFDKVTGESYYVPAVPAMLARMQKAGITQVSEDALIVPLDEYDMPPFMLRKSDETSLYATRDVCAALDRWEEYGFERCLYVVGSEQKLHFRQLRKVLELMGLDWAERIEHIEFGLLKFKDEATGRARKGSTRRGDMVLLEDVLRDGIEKAREKIRQNVEKLDEGADLDELAAQIGIGAVVFSDLSVKRTKDVLFEWDRMLDFEGDTGPYVQYAHARLSSILRKAAEDVSPGADCARLELAEEWALVRALEGYPAALALAAESREPSVVAHYLLDLCAHFSAYYSAGMREPAQRVLCEDASVRAARLLLVDAVRHVISTGLRLLGMAAPQRM